MREYRILEVTDGNNKSRFEVEWKVKKSWFFEKDEWYKATENERIGQTGWHINVKQEFDSLADAADYVRSKETISKLVLQARIEND